MFNEALTSPSNSSVTSFSGYDADYWDAVVRAVRAEYLSDSQDYPWIIGFSGGKDSTVVAQAMFQALLQIPLSQRRLTSFSLDISGSRFREIIFRR